MEFRSHFNLGDKAYWLQSTHKELFEQCPSCEAGHLVMKDGRQLQCPRCKGKGVVSTRSGHKWFVGQSLTIGQIRFEVSSEESKEQYMCRETGVGSGYVLPISDLYKTAALAQAEADKRNNHQEKEWYCTLCHPKFEPITYSIGFESRDWRYCSIHENTQHLVTTVAEKALEERAARLESAHE